MNAPERFFAQGRTEEDRASVGHVVAQSAGRSVLMGRLSNTLRMGDRVLFSGAPQTLGVVVGFETPAPEMGQADDDTVFIDVRTVGVLRGDGRAVRGSAQPAVGAEAFRVPRSIDSSQAAMDRPVTIGTAEGGTPVCLDAAALLGRSTAIIGDAGTGKSASLAVVMRALLSSRFPARLALIDPDGRFGQSFGRAADVVDASHGLLPVAMMTDDEVVALLARAGDPLTEDEQRAAYRLRRYAGAASGIDALREACARLRSTEMAEARLYDGLASRVRLLAEDPRFAAFAGPHLSGVSIEDILQRFFRLPVGSPPAAVIQLDGLAEDLRPLAASILMRIGLAVATGSSGLVPVLMFLDQADALFTELPELRSPGFGVVAAGEGLSAAPSGCVLLHRIRRDSDRERAIPEGEPLREQIRDVLANLDIGEALFLNPDYPWPVQVTLDALPPKAVPRPADRSPHNQDPAALLSAISEACLNSARG